MTMCLLNAAFIEWQLLLGEKGCLLWSNTSLLQKAIDVTLILDLALVSGNMVFT